MTDKKESQKEKFIWRSGDIVIVKKPSRRITNSASRRKLIRV